MKKLSVLIASLMMASGCVSLKKKPQGFYHTPQTIGTEYRVPNLKNYSAPIPTTPPPTTSVSTRHEAKTTIPKLENYTQALLAMEKKLKQSNPEHYQYTAHHSPRFRKVVNKSYSGSAATTIDQANRNARVKPNPDSYNNAIMTYSFSAGSLYQVYAAPLRLTNIQLQPGEKIMGTPAAGDTTRWILGVNESRVNGQTQKHIFIKPTRPGLKTTLIINTDRRTYLLELNSYKKTYMPAVSWQYPQDQYRKQHQKLMASRLRKEAILRLNKKRQAENSTIALQKEAARQRELEKLRNRNFNYQISYLNQKPVWTPLQVYDDGQKVYIRFHPNRQYFEAPALFVVSQSGQLQLVNYRVNGDTYIVDRLFNHAELRLGNQYPSIVKIRKTG